MTGPRLLFESTRDFLQSAIRTVIPLHQKIPCESKALRDYPAPGEKCGLVAKIRVFNIKEVFRPQATRIDQIWLFCAVENNLFRGYGKKVER
jgi:hypothetical protein